jgi:hypothetical protein
LYFAYGSNLNPQMAERCGIACRARVPARILDFAAMAVIGRAPWASTGGIRHGGVVFGARALVFFRYEGYDDPGGAATLIRRVEVTVEMESGGSLA